MSDIFQYWPLVTICDHLADCDRCRPLMSVRPSGAIRTAHTCTPFRPTTSTSCALAITAITIDRSFNWLILFPRETALIKLLDIYRKKNFYSNSYCLLSFCSSSLLLFPFRWSGIHCFWPLLRRITTNHCLVLVDPSLHLLLCLRYRKAKDYNSNIFCFSPLFLNPYYSSVAIDCRQYYASLSLMSKQSLEPSVQLIAIQ